MLFAPIDMSFNYYANLLNPRAGAPTIVIPDFKGYPTGAQPIPTADEVRSAIHNKRRVWLILTNNQIRLIPARGEAVPIIKKTVEEEFTLRTERQLPGQPNLTVLLYDRT
jgi:hypothetical protein